MTVPFHWDHSHGKIVVIKTYKTLMKIDSTTRKIPWNSVRSAGEFRDREHYVELGVRCEDAF